MCSINLSGTNDHIKQPMMSIICVRQSEKSLSNFRQILKKNKPLRHEGDMSSFVIFFEDIFSDVFYFILRS